MESSAGSSTPSLWRNIPFGRLYTAQIVSLVGSGLSSVALGLLAHQLVGASASAVLGITLAIRIVMIVLCAPWSGFVADRLGARTTMVLCDLSRAGVVVGFFFVESVWHIYLLAVLLNVGAALFTPVFKSTIPTVTSAEQYPRALALSSVAYDTANILGPSLAGLTIALVGFRGNFVIDALTFLVSASLIFGLPRLAAGSPQKKAAISLSHSMRTMFQRWQLRESIYLSLQVSVVGGFVLVATIDFIKSQLNLSDAYYAWVMGAYGAGSVLGATIYGKCGPRFRNLLAHAAAPAMLAALIGAGFWHRFEPVLVAWLFAGGGQSILGIRGNELLAANSSPEERPHIYSAHFSLSHAGWGLTYPLAGFIVTGLGFQTSAYIFAGMLVVASLPVWVNSLCLKIMHRGLSDPTHRHTDSAFEPMGAYHVHEHRHGEVVHSHSHRHD